MAWWKKKQISVTGLQQTGEVGRMVEFDIDASEAGKQGSPEVVINDGSPRCTVLALGNRQYRAAFLPREAKQHVIQIKFNGRNLPKNPFKIDIRNRQVTVSGPGLHRVPINQLTSFKVCTGDRSRIVLSATIKSPSGDPVEHYILDKDDGSYVVEYIPTQFGTYHIEVWCGGCAVSGNPFSSEVYDIYPVVSSVSNYTVGKTVEFEIDTSENGEGDLKVTIFTKENGNNCIIPSTMRMLQKGLFLVTFTPSSSEPTYASILFNSLELPQSPIRLDRHSPVQHDRSNQPITSQNLPQNRSRMHQPHPGFSTTCGSSLNYSAFRDDSDVHEYLNVPEHLRRDVPESCQTAGTSDVARRHEGIGDGVAPGDGGDDGDDDDDDVVHDYENVPQHLRRDVPESCETGGRADRVDEVKTYAQQQGTMEYVAPRFDALQVCVNEGTQHVYIVRQGLVDDLIGLYKDKNVANKTLSVEFVGEHGVDSAGLTKELFTGFWRDVSKDLFRGEDCLVPDLPLHRIRKESWKFECIGRILSHTVALTGTIPTTLARSILIKLITDSEIEDECLLEDFLLFVTTREKTLLTKAMTDFDGLTKEEFDRLQNFYTAHGFNNIPKAPEIKEQILAIAHHVFVEKPAPLISKMRQGIPESHRAAFWQRLSVDDITHIMQAQRPTPEKVASVITTDKEYMTDDEDRTLYFLKEFVASLDFDTLTDFLMFVTGSIHQPDKITVTFKTRTGMDRRPISHTCVNQLEVPTSYSSTKEFKREFKSVLASPEAFQYSEI